MLIKIYLQKINEERRSNFFASNNFTTYLLHRNNWYKKGKIILFLSFCLKLKSFLYPLRTKILRVKISKLVPLLWVTFYVVPLYLLPFYEWPFLYWITITCQSSCQSPGWKFRLLVFAPNLNWSNPLLIIWIKIWIQ